MEDPQSIVNEETPGLPIDPRHVIWFTIITVSVMLSLSLIFYLADWPSDWPSNPDAHTPAPPVSTQQAVQTDIQHITIQHMIVENHTTVVVVNSALILQWAVLLVLAVAVLVYVVVAHVLPYAASHRKSTDSQVKDGE